MVILQQKLLPRYTPHTNTSKHNRTICTSVRNLKTAHNADLKVFDPSKNKSAIESVMGWNSLWDADPSNLHTMNNLIFIKSLIYPDVFEAFYDGTSNNSLWITNFVDAVKGFQKEGWVTLLDNTYCPPNIRLIILCTEDTAQAINTWTITHLQWWSTIPKKTK